jgi:hypothetical protein
VVAVVCWMQQHRLSSNTAQGVMALVVWLGWAVMQPTVLAMTDDRPTNGTDNHLMYILTGFQGLKVLQGKAHLLVSNSVLFHSSPSRCFIYKSMRHDDALILDCSLQACWRAAQWHSMMSSKAHCTCESCASHAKVNLEQLWSSCLPMH